MPVSEQQQDQRGARLLVILFWGGVGLAPLAALILLFALRFGVILAVLAVVLIGLSIALRRDSDTVRIELQEAMLEELGQLRNDVREDMATAARNTHRSLTERINALAETVEGMRHSVEGVEAIRIQLQTARGQIEELQSRPMLAPAPAPAPSQQAAQHPGGGMVRTETVQVTRHTMLGTVYGSQAATKEPPLPRYAEEDAYPGRDRFRDSWDGEARWEPEAQWEEGHPRWGPERSEEWEAAPEPRRAEASGGRRRRRDDEDHHQEDRHREDRARDDRHREDRPHEGRRREDRHREERPEWSRSDRHRETGERAWEGASQGDRWASVHSDEHGSELRMGERRSSVRSDGHGTEMRVEDRWAAVRRAEHESSYGPPATYSPREKEHRPEPRALPAAPRGESPQAYTGGGRRGAEPEWERDGREDGHTARESKLVQAHRDAEARDSRPSREEVGRHEGRGARQGQPQPRSHRSNAKEREGDHEHVGAEYDWSPLQDFGAVEDNDDWGPEPSGAYPEQGWTGGSRVPRQRGSSEDYDRFR